MVDYPNIFANGMAAYDAQTQRLQQATDYSAQRQAGTSIANNDYAGAAAALGGAGDLKNQQAVTLAGQAQQSRTAQIGAATAYGNGDTQGAITALGPTGDIQTQSALHDKQIAEFQRQAAFTQQAATRLAAIRAQAKAAGAPDGGTGAILQAFDALAPSLKQMGTADQQIAGLRQSLQQNPDAVLGALATPAEYSFNVAGDTLVVSNKNTGQTVGHFTGDKFLPVGSDQSVIKVGGAGGQGVDAQPAAAGAATPAAAGTAQPASAVKPQDVWSSIIQQESGGKPGVSGPQTQYGQAQGLTQLLPKTAEAMAAKLGVPWQPELMTATTPEAAAYQERLGKAYFVEGLQKYGGDPTKAAMYYYGGPNEAQWGPKTHAYAQQVMARAGQAAPAGHAPLGQGAQVLTGSSGGDQVSQGQPQTAGGAQVVYQGPMARSMGAINANPDLTGADFLQTLPTSLQGMVKGIAEGRIAPPSAGSRSPQAQQILAAVAQYDPTFSAANATTRVATRRDFTSGKSANTLTAFNTALAHLSMLDQAAADLNNNGLPANNAAAHWIAGATGTDARVVQFDAVKRAALDEVNKALVGSGGALGDREALMKTMSDAASPATLHAAVKSLADLLQGKINAMGQQYTQGMGTDAYPIQLITPEAQRTIDRLEGRSSGRMASAPAAQPAVGGWGKVVVH